MLQLLVLMLISLKVIINNIHTKRIKKGEEKMHDQNSIDKDETSAEKYQRALDLFTESVMKPDPDLRGCAYNQGCYDDLMEIRKHVLESVSYTHLTLPTKRIV